MTLRVLVTKSAAIASVVTLLAAACDDTGADSSSNGASTVGATMAAPAPPTPAPGNGAAMGGIGTGAAPSATATPMGMGMPPAAGLGGDTGTPPGAPADLNPQPGLAGPGDAAGEGGADDGAQPPGMDVGTTPDADSDIDTGAGSDMATSGDPDMDNGSSSQACTREFLKTTIDQYFEALAAHDPSALPLARTVRFTENTAEATVGEGLVWQAAGEVKFTRSLLDTERCGTVTEAVFPNDGVDTIFGLRLQIAAGEITEIESIVVDPETGFFATPSGILNSTGNDWETVLPPEQRSTREELEAAGTAYFASFADESVQPPYGMPCDRLENGFKTTRGDCGNLGGAGGLRHPPQRYPVSDLEAGITAGFVLFAGGQIDFHMFKLVNHEIQFIDAVVGPRARTSGWD